MSVVTFATESRPAFVQRFEAIRAKSRLARSAAAAAGAGAVFLAALLALAVALVGWLLISISLPRLPAAVTSVVLTLQPVGSVALGVWLLAEDPSAFQFLGVLFILAGLLMTTLQVRAHRGLRRAARPAG